MNYIGIDYGLSKTGISISDSVLKVATIKDTVKTENLINYLKKLYKNGDIFIVGLPISMSGRYSKQTYETIDFCLKLKNLFNTDILLIDERLTTQRSFSMTKNFLNAKKAKKNKDQNSALLILQRFLDNPYSSIKLEEKKPYKLENIEYNSILINDIIIKNSNIYNKSDILAKNPYVFWWYFKRNKRSTTLFDDLKNSYDVLITKDNKLDESNITFQKIIVVGD